MTKLSLPDPTAERDAFSAMFTRDAEARAQSGVDWERSWLHLVRRLKQGALQDMDFTGFDGTAHLTRMYNWIDGIAYPNFLRDAAFDRLVALADAAEQRALAALDLDPAAHGSAAVSLYNAQDFRFQTGRPHPPRQRVRRFLDFGAGHGRQANLWSQAAPQLERFIAVDALPAPYLTQRLYFRALGLTLNDYMDTGAANFSLRDGRDVVNHLPSWRLDLIPDGSVDMICAVQVLRELSRPMLRYALGQFHRILRRDGGLYIRDHIGFHNVNLVDMDRLLAACGFVVEWQPMWIDGQDVHGIPRLWRKPNLNALIGGRFSSPATPPA